MQCKICGKDAQIAFKAKILCKYDEDFYKCEHCGFLSANQVHWLEEAYKDAINISDTGIVARNLRLYTIVVCVAYLFFGFRNKEKEPALLDLGGGNGLLVRLLRDSGIEAFWEDKYCQNFYARGFEWHRHKDLFIPALCTSFEVFEHLPNPKEEISSMLAICKNLLFSTELLPSEIPEPNGENAWWYYGFSHGQHISFFTRKSLESLAKANNVFFCSYKDLHLFSEHAIKQSHFKFAIKLAPYLFPFIKKRLTSKIQGDHQRLLKEQIAEKCKNFDNNNPL
ncbi:methyltransferase domain-containing protein [Helicobacter aurati]|uniref:Methyltransferase domain-containing protein n=1 Tax=Helicobacter aurati TaxID=137778 RepID=A0A3D8IZW4_9HELI|nr:methyltransferase domain-containing protein [Helicobacter aurati]RDU70500.1 methyltransferase domain-containing protein [Helicobacter aurati]